MLNLYQLCLTYPSVTGAFLIILGCILGSFVNVVVVRLPAMMKRQWHEEYQLIQKEYPQIQKLPQTYNLFLPRSHCSHCQAKIPFYHNIPLVSYLMLKGACHACEKPISKKYPVIESLAGLVALSAYLKFGCTTHFVGYLALGMALLTLTFIDLDEMLLPDQIVLPLLWAGLVFHLYLGSMPVEYALLGAVFGYLILWSVYWLFKIITKKEGMGYGDFKLLAAIGAWLGVQTLPMVLLIASVLGVCVHLTLGFFDRSKLSQAVPFGPYLSMAAWIVLLTGQHITSW
jgi:leader peptidase (prepilin peptidase)/N-methyltransferase